ncbi:MAG: zinc ABC transporter substrate-binding protein [Caenispirillum bisanense]|nr:zinc ABC transporter substrate-binding protein [Caenispirillum bisanense]MCA1974686.1 zinc ABC transporter substrate-binding protein [Caenispirillum sp.]
MPSPRASLFVTTALAAAGLLPAAALAEVPKVVTTVKPLHSLAAAVMQGVGEPELLLPPGASPHDYALKPSDARALDQADVVFWVGAPLEAFLTKPVQSLAGDARVVALASAPGLTLLPTRVGGAWEAHAHEHYDHGHDEQGHDDHAHAEEHAHEDEHGHADAHDHEQDKAHAAGHDEHEHEHEHIEPLPALDADAAELPPDTDAHVWLDPDNAAVIARTMAGVLAEADAANAAAYRANAEAVAERLAALTQELTTRLQPVAGVPYVVFHDAYQYLEHDVGLTPVGSITVEPGRPVGARRIAELRDKVTDLKATCVFAEPQFEPRLVATITEGTTARAGVLDPLGTDIPPGPGMYEALMRGMADSLLECLAPKG